MEIFLVPSDEIVSRDLVNPSSNFGAIPFGAAGDVPTPGDYDGDGKTDAAVYRGGTWYILQTTAGFTAAGFGLPTDQAVPAAYDPQ